MLPDLRTDLSGGRSGGLVFSSLSEFSTVCHDPQIKGFGIFNKAEVVGFLEVSCFFEDPMDVGNLISGSSAFSKTSLNIWKFTVHILLNPGLENFEHYFASMRWVQLCGSLSILWHCLYLGLEWNWPFPVLFQCCGHCRVFQICWHIECSTFTASSFRIWNSSTGIPSPLLCFFIKPLDFTFQDVWL